MKDEIVKFLQELYKPKSQFEQEKVEYNHINILAEFILYNIIFAKNELMFDEFKVAMMCDMFWRLLEFDPEDDSQSKPPTRMSEGDEHDDRKGLEIVDSAPKADKSRETSAQKLIEFRGDGIEIESEFEIRLKHKINLFKRIVIDRINDSNPALNINVQDAQRITKYA